MLRQCGGSLRRAVARFWQVPVASWLVRRAQFREGRAIRDLWAAQIDVKIARESLEAAEGLLVAEA